MAKLIFTADDYGIVEAIDNGVCEAISEGWINSVEVFPNDPNKVQRSVQKLGQLDLGKFAQAQGIPESDAVINVGAHHHYFRISTDKIPIFPTTKRVVLRGLSKVGGV